MTNELKPYRLIKCITCNKIIGVTYYQKLIKCLDDLSYASDSFDHFIDCLECGMKTLNQERNILIVFNKKKDEEIKELKEILNLSTGLEL